MKRWHLLVTSLVLVFSSTVVGARELPSLDAFADRVPSTPRAGLKRSSSLLGVRVLHTEPRLGVPTLVWGNPSGTDPRIRSGLRRMGPEQAARAHLARLAPLYGLTPEVAALAPARVEEPADGQGPSLVTFRQDVEGVEVFRHQLTLVLNEQHELVGASGYLSPHVAPETRLGKLRFRLSDREAIALAYADLNGERLEATSLEPAGPAQGAYTSFALSPGERARYGKVLVTPARARRVLFPLPERLVPAWYVELHTGAASGQDSDSYAYVIAADDGRLLLRHDLTASDAFSYRVWAEPSEPFLPQDGPQGFYGSPLPGGQPGGFQPPFIAPTLVTLQNAPFSQNDPWLPPGATESVGNNVDAYVDVSGADGRDASDFRASTTGAGSFDRVYDVSLQPGASASQRMAAVTQLFYVTNFLHDWFYDAGFDEASGNAQSDNYGRGGLGNDSLLAEAQDFSGQNNATMTTPADGARPRLQVYLFAPNTRYGVTVTSPAPIAGDYAAGLAAFGPQSFDLTADIALADDGSGTRTDACQALVNDVAGKIVLIDRPGCTVIVKTKNAQSAGAAGVIIANSAAGPPPTLNGTDASLVIPAVSVTQSDGNLLKASLSSSVVRARLLHEAAPSRDGSLDNTIVSHEWGHLISNRLIANGTGLTNQQGRALGEGWADFHALLMMARQDDVNIPSNGVFEGVYVVGGYVAGGKTSTGADNEGFYFGLRRYPYSTDFSRNPLTLRYIQHGVRLPSGPPLNAVPAAASNAEAHNAGEVWATMLWECYTALVRSGAGLTFAQAQERMKHYLVMSYKLTPPLPTFLEARDALLMAVYANEPAHYSIFASAFARRGAGLRAVAPDRESTTHAGVVESFVYGKDVDFESAELIEAPGSCDSDGVVDHGEAGLLRVTLSNMGMEPLTDTTARVSSTDSGVVIGNAGRLSFPAIPPLGMATVEVPVSVSGDTAIRSIRFNITYGDAYQAIPGERTASFEARVNTDEAPNSSATEDVEGRQVVWTASRDPSLGNFGPWQRASETPLANYFHGPDAPAKADIYLASPPLVVGSTGSFGFTFLHRYRFDADTVDLYDGGVIELSEDDGATWTDIGAYASPGYAGTISTVVSNPLSGRDAYGDISENYPAWNLETVDLGAAYQGKTVRIRFRIGSDNNISEAGWDIDHVSFTGITNTPFTTVTAESNACANNVPVAEAGQNQTVWRGDSVVLDGRGSLDADTGTTLSYSWIQMAGPAVTLNGANTAQPGFTAPTVTADTVLTFQLTVSDGRALSLDTVDVTVSTANRAPVANAGPDQQVNERTEVRLDGRGSSDPDTGSTLSYAWVQIAGPSVTLRDATSSQPGFTAPEVTQGAQLTFQLTVSDGLDSSTDTVDVTVLDENRAPTADAGADLSAVPDAVIVLTGRGMDPDGDVLHFEWTQAAGLSVELHDASTLSPSFTAPEVSAPTELTFKLRATDPGGLSGEDTVSVVVNPKSVPDGGTGDGGVNPEDGGVNPEDGGVNPGDGGESPKEGCGCGAGSSSASSVVPLLLLGLLLSSRRRRSTPIGSSLA